MSNIYYDFWYLKSEEIELDGSETGMACYEIAIGVFADRDMNEQLDDIRITGLNKDEMLSFKIEQPEELFPMLEEEGLFNIVEDIRTTGNYSVMGDKKINVV